MSRVLASTVVLMGKDGLPVVLLPGTVPTKKQASQITNPHAWADAPAEEIEVEEPAAEVEADKVAGPAEDEADHKPESDEAPASDDKEAPAAEEHEDAVPPKSQRSK